MSLEDVIANKPTDELIRICKIESAQSDLVLMKHIDAELTKRKQQHEYPENRE